ncbi:MAG: hypothetical protein KAX80_15190, partial [Planctomycetes bacterium]|nr:hypothetical protein [Planctomycetota bacterium]
HPIIVEKLSANTLGGSIADDFPEVGPVTEADARSDEALVEAANRGEVAAFEALYRRYRDWIVRYDTTVQD